MSLTIGIVGTVRARAWASRRASRATGATIVRCLPYAVAALVPAFLPLLLRIINRGAPVPWDVIVSVWPPLPILVVVSALAGAAIVICRSRFLWRPPAGATHGAASEAGSQDRSCRVHQTGLRKRV